MSKSIADVYSEVKDFLSQSNDVGRLIEIPLDWFLKLISFMENFKCASDITEASKHLTLFW